MIRADLWGFIYFLGVRAPTTHSGDSTLCCPNSPTALDEVRAHTGQYIWMADVDPRLDAAVALICGRQRVVPTIHTSTDVPNLSGLVSLFA